MATTVTDRFSESPQSLWPRGRVRVATTANITLATDLQSGDTIDGKTLATGDLVLVKNQTTQADNGIYRCGDGGARAPGFQTFNDIAGNTFSVLEGTTNGDTTWQCTADYGGTLGTTALPFSQFDGGAALGSLDNDTGNFIVGVGGSFQSQPKATARTSMGAQVAGGRLDEVIAVAPPGALRLLGLDDDTGGTVRAYGVGPGLVLYDTGTRTIDADIGRWSEYIPAGAMVSETTDGPTWGINEMATNKNMLPSWDFDDTGPQYAQFNYALPTWWNRSTLSYKYYWSHASDTGATQGANGVMFQLQAVAVQNDGAADVAFGSAIAVSDAGGTGNDLYESAESAAVTVAGTLTGGPFTMFRVLRVPGNAADTMTANARLHGVKLFLTRSSLKDT